MGMISGIFSMIGGIVQAQGAQEAAQAQAAAAEYNAQVAERNRGIIHEQTKVAVADQVTASTRIFGQMRAAYGHSGIDMSGSSVEVMNDTSIELALDRLRTTYKGRLQEIEQTDTATLQRMAGSAALKAGQIAATSAILGGLGGLVSSFGSMMGLGGALPTGYAGVAPLTSGGASTVPGTSPSIGTTSQILGPSAITQIPTIANFPG